MFSGPRTREPVFTTFDLASEAILLKWQEDLACFCYAIMRRLIPSAEESLVENMGRMTRDKSGMKVSAFYGLALR